MTKYVFSLNGENFNNCDGESIDEIIKELIENEELEEEFEKEGHAIVHIGEPVGYGDNGEDCYDKIIDYFKEEAYEFGGEDAEYYLDTVTKEAEEYLKKELNKIWKKFKKINKEVASFYQVENVKVYKVEEAGIYSEIEKDK